MNKRRRWKAKARRAARQRVPILDVRVETIGFIEYVSPRQAALDVVRAAAERMTDRHRVSLERLGE